MKGSEVIKTVNELNDIHCGLDNLFHEFAQAYGLRYNEVLDFMTTVNDDDVESIYVKFRDIYNRYDDIIIPADVFGDSSKVQGWVAEEERKVEEEQQKAQQEKKRDEYLRAKQCVEDYERKYGDSLD